MEPENSQNSPPPTGQAHWTFEDVMQVLSDMPTDRAMKDVGNRKLTPAVIKVIETMALHKQDLVKAMRQIETRERWHSGSIAAIRQADKVILEYLKDNPDYTVSLHRRDDKTDS